MRLSDLRIAVAGAALVAGALLVWSLTRSLTVPLRRLRHRLTEIADGNGDLTQRIDADRKDELGQDRRQRVRPGRGGGQRRPTSRHGPRPG